MLRKMEPLHIKRENRNKEKNEKESSEIYLKITKTKKGFPTHYAKVNKGIGCKH